MDQLLTRFQDKVQAAGGKIATVEKKGLVALAYRFQAYKDVSRAYYVNLTFEGQGKVPQELEGIIRVTEEVIRHIITKVN